MNELQEITNHQYQFFLDCHKLNYSHLNVGKSYSHHSIASGCVILNMSCRRLTDRRCTCPQQYLCKRSVGVWLIKNDMIFRVQARRDIKIVPQRAWKCAMLWKPMLRGLLLEGINQRCNFFGEVLKTPLAIREWWRTFKLGAAGRSMRRWPGQRWVVFSVIFGELKLCAGVFVPSWWCRFTMEVPL